MRVLIADDHRITAEGIRAILERRPGFAIIGVATNGEYAVRMAEETQPDLLIMDVSMPVLNGIEAASRIRALAPRTKIIFLTMHSNAAFVKAALRAGAAGYMLKERAPDDLLSAIRTVMANRAYLCPVAARALKKEASAKDTERGPSARPLLTSRELQVLRLIAESLSTKQIGDRLGISLKTVSTHRQNVMDKLGIHDIAGLTRYAIQTGVVDLTA